MEKLIRFKDTGIKRHHQKRYDEAIKEFNKVIEGLPEPKTDEEAVLKGVCYANLSSCYLYKEKYEEANKQANLIVDLYNSMRPEEVQKNYTPEKMREDTLIPILSIAYLRRGQILESQDQFLEALQEYSISTTFVPDGEAQPAIKSLYTRIGIPIIDQTDKDLQPFAVILLHLLVDVNLINALNRLIEFLQSDNIPTEIIEKIIDTQCSNILYGVMQLYDNEIIVIQCLFSLSLLVVKRVSTVWAGYLVLRMIMLKWSKSEKVIGESIKLLRLAPLDLFSILAHNDFISILMESFKLSLTEDEVESNFLILYHMTITPPLLAQVVAEGMLDVIIEKKTIGALMVLGKISLMKDVVMRAEEEGVIEWVFEMISKHQDNPEIIASCSIYISRVILYQKQPDEVKDKERAVRICDLLVPPLMKHTKNIDVVSSVFAALALSASYVPEKITELRIIRAASAILSLHLSNQAICKNIVSFLFTCASIGLVNEINDTRAALPTAMKALSTFAEDQTIVERGVALAFLCNHSKKETLLQSALTQFSESEFLKEFIKEHQAEIAASKQ